jgi:hypothetical protein
MSNVSPIRLPHLPLIPAKAGIHILVLGPRLRGDERKTDPSLETDPAFHEQGLLSLISSVVSSPAIEKSL